MDEKTKDNGLYGWDLTLSADEKKGSNNFEKIKDVLKEIAKKWVFQKEEAKGYIHWQMRVSLMKKKRMGELVDLLKNTELKGAHCSPTTKGEYNGEKFSYVMKLDTRIEGPWKDDDPSEEKKVWSETLAKMKEKGLYKWQKQIVKSISLPDDDCINVLLDVRGISGKSALGEWLQYHKLARVVPPFVDFTKIMGWCYCMPGATAYVVDMPRGMEQHKCAPFWTGIENLKTGHMFDWRHKAQEKRLEKRPIVWIFGNTKPKKEYITKTRFQLWMINYETLGLMEFDDEMWKKELEMYNSNTTQGPSKKRKFDFLDVD